MVQIGERCRSSAILALGCGSLLEELGRWTAVGVVAFSGPYSVHALLSTRVPLVFCWLCC